MFPKLVGIIVLQTRVVRTPNLFLGNKKMAARKGLPKNTVRRILLRQVMAEV